MAEILKRILIFGWDIIESLTFTLGFFLVAYLFLFQTAQVYGASSYPTVIEGERFITDKTAYYLHQPECGDFVVVISPRNVKVVFRFWPLNRVGLLD